jgi:hypothetical protein
MEWFDMAHHFCRYREWRSWFWDSKSQIVCEARGHVWCNSCMVCSDSTNDMKGWMRDQWHKWQALLKETDGDVFDAIHVVAHNAKETAMLVLRESMKHYTPGAYKNVHKGKCKVKHWWHKVTGEDDSGYCSDAFQSSGSRGSHVS